MGRGKRAAERGAETLEFLGLLPLFIIVIFVAWQGLILLHQESEAQNDAQTLARATAICGTGSAPPSLASIDPSAHGTAYVIDNANGYVTAHVTLDPISVFQNLSLSSLGFPAPSAVVTMRHEPCS